MENQLSMVELNCQPQSNAIQRLWYTEKEVSVITGISVSSLQKARHFRSSGLPYYKINRSIRYLLADIERFMAENRIVPAQ